MPNFIQIHPKDTVAVALGKIEKGTVFQGVTALEDIPQGHKMALKEMASNTQVMKYGFSIGHATENIKPGSTPPESTLQYRPSPQRSPALSARHWALSC